MKFEVAAANDKLIRSGAYVGGIGAGGFEPRADGKLHRCQIFNDWRTESTFDLSFSHFGRGGKRVLQLNDYISAWYTIKGVRRTEYKGEFCSARISFPETGVSIEYSSFFIPGNLKDSSLPAVRIRVTGRGRLVMGVPVPFQSTVKQGKDTVTLAGDKRSVSVSCSSGTLCGVHGGFRRKALANVDHANPLNESRKAGKDKRDHAIVAVWNGRFDDELILTWHCPDNMDLEGHFMGHYYANFFDSSDEVMKYVKRNLKALRSRTDRYCRSIHGSRLPVYMRESQAAQLATFVKQSWLTKDGKFGVWEGGCCCCGLQTTDVSYYGSWLYVKLFPELEKSGMRLTAKFQRRDGWIPHFFPGTFHRIDEYRRKDMNMQFVLMVWRDVYLWKDLAFLKEMWPYIRKAMACIYTWDVNGDRIPEVEGKAQTFDAWGFTGCSIYLATLWLASLKAAAKMAKMMGDASLARKWTGDYPIVRKNIINTFWNGEYFILAVDGKKKDECCLIDALSGDWYMRLCGLGGMFGDDMVKSHLSACIKYNRKRIDHSYMKWYATPDEKGWCCINGGYRKERRLNGQQCEPWTGLEITLALHLWIMGMKKQAMQVMQELHDRKLACGQVWNHIECGGEYFRPMVVGALWDEMRK